MMDIKRPRWAGDCDRVEVTTCAVCPTRHEVALTQALADGRDRERLVAQALALDGWRLAQVFATADARFARGRFAWICPCEEPSHAFVTIGGEREAGRVVVVEGAR